MCIRDRLYTTRQGGAAGTPAVLRGPPVEPHLSTSTIANNARARNRPTSVVRLRCRARPPAMGGLLTAKQPESKWRRASDTTTQSGRHHCSPDASRTPHQTGNNHPSSSFDT
eukprot:3864179-Prorocentrum_lima.AAC.1